jgi:hypothetical protein
VLQNAVEFAAEVAITSMAKMHITMMPAAPCKGANWRGMWVLCYITMYAKLLAL